MLHLSHIPFKLGFFFFFFFFLLFACQGPELELDGETTTHMTDDETQDFLLY